MSSDPLDIVRTVQLAVLVPINLIGNFLVCIMVTTQPAMRSPMNWLLVNLALADMMVAVFMVIDQLFLSFVAHPDNVEGDLMCKFLTGKLLSWIASVASVVTLLAIAFERHSAILYPHRERLDRRKIRIIVAACWLFSIAFNTPIALVRKRNHDFESTGFLCRSYWPNIDLAKAYNILWLVVVGVIPLTIMTVLFGRIVHSLWFTGDGAELDSVQIVRLRARKRITKMLIILVVLYALCWFPNLIINVVLYYVYDEALASTGYLISEVLVLLNSSINPFVYAIQSQQFRRGMKRAFLCYKCRTGRVAPLGQAGGTTELYVTTVSDPQAWYCDQWCAIR